MAHVRMKYLLKITYTPDDPDSDRLRHQTTVHADTPIEAAQRGLALALPKVIHPVFAETELPDAMKEFQDAIAEDDGSCCLPAAHVEWSWAGNDGAFFAVLHGATE